MGTRPEQSVGSTAEVPYRSETTCILSQLMPPQDGVPQVQIRERTWQWARPQVEGTGPCARGGHSATLVGPIDMQKASARIFMFGGHFDSGGKAGFSYLNDVHILDIDENMWAQPRCRGTAPEARYGHSAALVGTRIVYFGGRGKDKHFRDLHALDAATLTWYQGPSSGGAPSARHGHTATLHGTRLYVFGGVCGASYFGDLHCLDLQSMAWSSPTTTGPKPTPRFGHTALLIGETLLIHGGFFMDTMELTTKDNSGQLLKNCYLNDIRVLDLGRMLWSRLRTHGEPPVGRFGHTLVLSDDDAVLFGGWSGTSKDNAPGVMFSLRDKMKGEGEETGATQEDQTCDYCMTLRTADMKWIKNKYVGVPASKRYGHSATGIGPHLIIIGGWDGGKPLSDVIVLRDRSVADKAGQSPLFDGEGAEEDLDGDMDGAYGDALGRAEEGVGDEEPDDWMLVAGDGR